MTDLTERLRSERRQIQEKRDDVTDLRRVKLAVRTFGADLETRVDRLERDLDPGEADPLDALDRFLDFGTGGGLEFLREGTRAAVEALPIGSGTRLAAMTVDSVGPPSGGTRYEWETRGAFPTALGSYVRGNSDRSRVRRTVADLLATDDASRIDALRWYVEERLHGLVAGATEDTVAALNEHKAEHVETLERTDSPGSSTDPLTALTWENPVAMLPVRLETRFANLDGDHPQLLVRVYPDQVHVDSHESALTDAEYEWGTGFWTRLWFACHPMPPADALDDRDAWDVYGGDQPGSGASPNRLPTDRLRELAVDLYDQIRAGAFSDDMSDRFREVRERAWATGRDRFGAERAAYVAHALAPNAGSPPFGERALGDGSTPPWETSTNPPDLRFPTVDRRPASWTETPTAELLPDRWVVYLYWTDGRSNPPANRPTDWQSAGNRAWMRWDSSDGRWVKKVTGSAIHEPLAVGPSPEAVAGRDREGDEEVRWMTEFGAAKTVGMGLEVDLPTGRGFSPSEGFEEVVVTGTRTSSDARETADAVGDLLKATEYTDGLEFLTDGTPTNSADPDEPAGGADAPTTAAETAATKVGRSLVTPDRGALRSDGYHPLDGQSFETDGRRLERALGVVPATSGPLADRLHLFGHVHNADGRAHENAGHVNESIWPATWGYYVKNMLLPGSWDHVVGADGSYLDPLSAGAEEDETDDEESGDDRPDAGERIAQERPDLYLLTLLAAYRNHFRRHVRSEGPFSTLRMGDQPYGVLPVTPLNVDSDAPASGASYRSGGFETGPGGLRYLAPDRIDEGAFMTDLIRRLWPLRDVWLESARSNLPRIGADRSLEEQELLDLFSMEASGNTFRRQSWLVGQDNAAWRLFDDEREYDLGAFRSGSGSRTLSRRHREETRRRVTLPTELYGSRIDDLRFAGQSGLLASPWHVVDDEFDGFVHVLRALLDDSLYRSYSGSWQAMAGPDGWLPRLRTLGGNWRFEYPREDLDDTGVISWMVTTSRTALHVWDRILPYEITTPAIPADRLDWHWLTTNPSLARQLLYFAAMREVASAGLRLGALYDDPLEIGPEPDLYTTGDTIFDELDTRITGGTAQPLVTHPQLQSIHSPTFADAVREAFDTGSNPDIDPLLSRFDRSVDHLTALDHDRYQDLLMGTLGACSHRLDAWWTSVATRQLWNLREGQAPGDRGVHVGAFGYVENLSAGSDDTGEYLLAPSRDQVTAAAMMRSVHSHTADQAHEQTLAIDLSAERVETARSYLSAIRSGLSLSDVLGYRFERRLHEENLETHIATFRQLAPARAGKIERSTSDSPSPDTEARGSDVVDGLALYRRWTRGTLPWGSQLTGDHRMPGPGSSAAATVDEILSDLHHAMDAVNDVLTAEGIYQLSRGNPERASAALEALSRGKRVPELEFLRTPRQATGINHRLFVLFGDASASYDLRKWAADTSADELIDPPADLPSLSGYSVPSYEATSDRSAVASPRARDDAEPNLNGWVSELLPQPDRVGCPVEFQWTDDRAFAVGSFETPTERGVVDVTDVGFEPDVVLFTVAGGVGGDGGGDPSSSSESGWTHGAFRRRTDAADVQHALSLVAHADRNDAEYVFSDNAALAVVVPTADGTGGTHTGTVAATHDDGFTVRFGPPPNALDRPYRVQYRAIRTGDESRVRVGHFTTANRQNPGTDTLTLGDGGVADAGGSTLRGGLGDPSPLGGESSSPFEVPDLSGEDEFDPDYLLLTGTNAPPDSDAGEDRAARGSLSGFSHGEVVSRAGTISQRATASTVAPGSENPGAFVATDDAALSFVYGDGDGRLDRQTTIRVTGLGHDVSGGNVELSYDGPADDDEGSFGGFPQLVTYAAIESPPADVPGESSHAPAIGAFAVPRTDGETVTVDVPFDPALVALTTHPGATVTTGTPEENDGGGDVDVDVRGTATSGSGWSHGVATGSAAQSSLGQVTRSGVGRQGSDAVAGIGSDTATVSLPSLDGNGDPAGTTTGRVTETTEGSFTVAFPSVAHGDGSERLVVFWTAWPTDPTERAFAVDGTVSLEDLDVGPLDAVALTQESDRAGDSQLERRIRYHAFRHRPEHDPPIPDDAVLELTFGEPGSDDARAVSVAAYLEQARAIREVISEGRPADAEDFTHPAESDGPGYLPANKPDDVSDTVAKLRTRGDAVHDLLADATAILENRVALFDVGEDERRLTEKVDRIDAAVRAFGQAVPAGQLDVVADDLDKPSTTDTLLDELDRLTSALRAGETDPQRVTEPITVETGGPDETTQTVAVGTELDAETEVEVTIRPLSDASRFDATSETTTTDGNGRVSVSIDASNLPPGARFAVSVVTTGPQYPPLDVLLRDELSGLSASDLADLAEWVVRELTGEEWEEGFRLPRDDDGSTGDRSRWPARSEWESMSTDERLDAFQSLPREPKLGILELLDVDEALEFYTDGDGPTGLVGYETGRVVDAPESTHADRLARTLAGTEVLGPLLWLARVHERVDTDADTLGRRLDTALAPGTIDHGLVRTEKRLMRRVAKLASPTAFSGADFEAVELLDRLLGFDVTDLSDAMVAAFEPLQTVGLTDLVSLTGELSRPAEQSYWRRPDCSVDAALGKHCEGSVRARVRNFTPAPAAADEEFLQRYAPALRRSVDSTDLTTELVRTFDRLVSDPVAFVTTLEPEMDRPDLFVQSLHELLYHPRAFTERANASPSTFLSRFDALVRALGSRATRARLDETDAAFDPGVLLAAARAAPGRAFRTYVDSLDDDFGLILRLATHDDFETKQQKALGTLSTRTDRDLERRFVPAYNAGDLATPFRAGVLETVRRGLMRASYLGVYGSTPQSAAGGSPADVTDLLEQATAVLEELHARDATAGGLDTGQTVSEQVERIEALLGDTVTVLPPFAPTNPGELSAALMSSDELVADRYDVDTWLLRNARLREHPRAFRQMRSYADHFDVTATSADRTTPSEDTGARESVLTRSLTVGQLPVRDPAEHPWVGSDGVTPRGDELSLVGRVVTNALTPTDGEPVPVATTPGTPPVAGLFVDGWVERVPDKTRTIGVGFEYDEPDVRPPQSILLAVPPAWTAPDRTGWLDEWTPTASQRWTRETLRTTLDETRDLVKMRGVDLDALDDVGHVLPALTLAYNENTAVWEDEDTVYLPDAPSVDLDRFPWHLLGDRS